jgi:hypothetical protein
MVVNSFKEALLDTGLALILNVPINYFLLVIADKYSMSVAETTIFLTGTFTVLAIIRKTVVGTYFKINTKEL